MIMVKISETDGERKQNFWFFKLFSKIVFIFSSAVYFGCIENLESSQHSNVVFFHVDVLKNKPKYLLKASHS